MNKITKDMDNILVAFSSTDVSEELLDKAINLAKKKKGKLILLDVRDKEMSEKVGELTENFGFMGDKVIGELKKDISHGRCEVIYQKLSTLTERLKKSGVDYEVVVEKGPFEKSVKKVSKEKNVKTVLHHKRGWLPWGEELEIIEL